MLFIYQNHFFQDQFLVNGAYVLIAAVKVLFADMHRVVGNTYDAFYYGRAVLTLDYHYVISLDLICKTKQCAQLDNVMAHLDIDYIVRL